MTDEKNTETHFPVVETKNCKTIRSGREKTGSIHTPILGGRTENR